MFSFFVVLLYNIITKLKQQREGIQKHIRAKAVEYKKANTAIIIGIIYRTCWPVAPLSFLCLSLFAAFGFVELSRVYYINAKINIRYPFQRLPVTLYF